MASWGSPWVHPGGSEEGVNFGFHSEQTTQRGGVGMANAKKYRPKDYRVGTLHHGVEGVEPLTQEGTPVPQDKLAQVEKAAASINVEIEEAKE